MWTHIRRAIIIIIVVITLFLGLETIGNMEVVRLSVLDLSYVQGGLTQINNWLDRCREGLAHYEEIKAENESLRLENQKLKNDISKLHYVSKENGELRSLLKLKDRFTCKNILFAQVAARDPNGWKKEVVLDKGYLDGVVENMAAVDSRGLLGKVTDVARNSCRLELLDSCNLEIPLLLSSSRVHGVLVCDNYKRFIVKYVHYDVSVKKGELVLTSGLGNIYPGGIAVGKVEKTMAGTEAFAQDISVILEVDFAKIL